MPLALRTTPHGVILKLRVSPGASRSRISGLRGDALKIAVAAPPEKGKANIEVIALLAAALGASKGAVTIVAGETSRDKQALIRGMNADDIESKLLISEGKAT